MSVQEGESIENETSVKKDGNWYAVQTLSNKESTVKKHIERYLAAEEMDDFIYEVLMPTETVTEIKGGKKIQKVRKLYVNYLFIHMRLFDENGAVLDRPWYYVNGIDGVISIVGGKNPIPLRKDEIDRILEQVKDSVGKEVPKINFVVGEDVKINDGPFLNLNGRIDEIDIEKGKLKVSVSIFGRFTPVELEFWQVEHITE